MIEITSTHMMYCMYSADLHTRIYSERVTRIYKVWQGYTRIIQAEPGLIRILIDLQSLQGFTRIHTCEQNR